MVVDANMIALTLIGIGLSFLIAFWSFKYQSQKIKNYILRFYRVNNEVNQDTLDFIERSWPILQEAGFMALQGKVEWFGETKEIAYGTPKNSEVKNQYPISLFEGDIRVDMTLFYNQVHGERKLLYSLLLQTYLMLLSFNVTNKTSQFLLSKQRLEKYQLFVQHDVKNIAQFISLLDSQVADAKADEDKVKLLNRLKMLLPAMAEKAKLVTQQMTSVSHQSPKKISLSYEIEKIAHSIGLSVQVDGEACLLISDVLLTQLLNNLLGNFKDHPENVTDVFVQIKLVETGLEVNISRLKASSDEALKPERMFEPFWTTSESGMGLGLFLTREMLNNIGGEVHFYHTDDEIGFKILLAKAIVCS